MKLSFNISFADLYVRDGLIKLDKLFLDYIRSKDLNLFHSLKEARHEMSPFLKEDCQYKHSFTVHKRKKDSQLVIDTSYLLDAFIAKLFNIEKETKKLKKRHEDFALIYKCKKIFIQRYLLSKSIDNIVNIDIDYVINRLSHFITLPITEKKFAEKVMYWFKDKDLYKEEIEMAEKYTIWRLKNKPSVLFSTRERIDHENLVSFSKEERSGIEVLYSNKIKRRYGFDLTTEETDLNEVLDNANYCIFCHKQNKDSCSSGLKITAIQQIGHTCIKKGCTSDFNKKFLQSHEIFKKSPLKIELHGCPLEQKISEMNLVKSEGYSIASLAIIMIDNPLCAATGRRICNDCMNSCIYQKQEPVNIPIIETKVLDDVLSLPYGFEIYSLLSRWNPLNFKCPLPKENTGRYILVVGLGPAGFSLAHYLLNDGHNVIAIDGLKIEPLVDNLKPIRDFRHERLSRRTASGFGGVAEYGITSRWNKNYLKCIRLLLERRKNFALYGGVRFGSTLTVNDAFDLGFDHIALSLGSGRPKIIKMKNMLVRGVRMASDFLMSLQLNRAFEFNSIINLQIRMPIVIIGSGLTAIDAATEALAYYPIQVEKFLFRYKILVSKYGKDYIEKDWTEEERSIANEFILHAKLIKEEKELARKDNREARILELIQSLGGVKIIYRKELKSSPGYRINSKEVQNALSEGILYLENLEPVEIITDKYNHAESIKLIDTKSYEIKFVKARAVLIAAGTEPNTVIATEDRKHFKLSNGYFVHLDSSSNEVNQVFSPKVQDKNRIFAYKQGNKAISFFGDLHPSYRGSVVKAIASAKNGYSIISQLLEEKKATQISSQLSVETLSRHLIKKFFKKIEEQLTVKIVRIQYLTDKVVKIIIKAPLAAKNFKPGQFFRLQSFERNNKRAIKLAMESIAVTGSEVNKKKGIISTIVLETGGSTDLCKCFKKGERIILMGPTGCHTEV